MEGGRSGLFIQDEAMASILSFSTVQRYKHFCKDFF